MPAETEKVALTMPADAREDEDPGVSGTGPDSDASRRAAPSGPSHSAAITATHKSSAAGASSSACLESPPTPSTQGEPGDADTYDADDEEKGASYEQQHVHSVYESIASHFSATRYKPWPVIASFLLSLPAGSVGLDVGCGNGKYLAVNPGLFIMGSDRSAALARIARDHGGPRCSEAAVADGLALPYRDGWADFAICVAVIHHMSTRERRRAAVRALLDCVRPGGGQEEGGGRILVYVWALEQSSSRRGWDEGADQDQLVPWVMKSKGVGDTTYQRYYHLYKKGELEEDIMAVGGRVLSNGYDKDNWWAIASRAD